MTILIGLGCFFVGVVVGVVVDDAWRLYRSSRKDRRIMWNLPRLTELQTLVLLLLVAVVVNIALGILLVTTRVSEEDAERQNKADAVTACHNSNEAREANLSLWTFVLQLSAANREEEPTPAEQQRLDDFRAWVTELYAPHDCSDLSKKYPIPPPPPIAR